eukprot:2775044-Alexandrium_andersonii.AAC.1
MRCGSSSIAISASPWSSLRRRQQQPASSGGMGQWQMLATAELRNSLDRGPPDFGCPENVALCALCEDKRSRGAACAVEWWRLLRFRTQ